MIFALFISLSVYQLINKIYFSTNKNNMCKKFDRYMIMGQMMTKYDILSSFDPLSYVETNQKYWIFDYAHLNFEIGLLINE